MTDVEVRLRVACNHEWRVVPPQRPSAETLWFYCIHCLEQVSRQRKRKPGAWGE